MVKVTGSLIVFFEKPFWVGIFEHIENGELAASKVTFGAEPKDCEVYEFVLKYYYDLQFSQALTIGVKGNKKRTQNGFSVI